MLNEVQLLLLSIMQDEDNPFTLVSSHVRYEPTPFGSIHRILFNDKHEAVKVNAYDCDTNDIVTLLDKMMFDLKDGFSIEKGFKVGD